ncbi:MAG: type II toxin-antitoxin system VapC family toxin [Candidatus Melainabacteria bacterium]|nr:type II toxin-antitoxin system VapC family toxin [Candidatus Melainabacteria bacterium]
MIYPLDTNAVIAILEGQPAIVRDRLRGAMSASPELIVSTIVLFELWYGVARSAQRKENAERLRVFLSGDITIAPFEDEDAVLAGDMRAALQAAGTPIGSYDLLIAAQALRTGATLVTANVGEFSRIGGLAWQDWSKKA